MLTTVISLPYEVARLPLVALDRRLSERLPETSGARVVLDRAIGSADRLAGTLLRNHDIAERGADRAVRTDRRLEAARLEQEAAARREQARQTAAAGRQKATRARKAAQDRAATGLAEADAAEARGKQEAKDRAARSAATKKAAADRRAATRKAAAAQQRRNAEAAAETRKATAQRPAKEELAEARATKRSAAGAKDDAQRLADLAEAKKQVRTDG